MSLRNTTSRYLAPFTLPSFVLSSPAYATLLPVALGSVVGIAVSGRSTQRNRSQEQYESLKRPPGHPPGWIFGPVWTALYGMMGYASYRVYSTGMSSAIPAVRQAASQGVALYSTSLVLNYIWMPLFFSLNLPRLALADILLLSVNVAAATGCFFKVDKAAGYMMVPYMAWLGFATYLCAGVGYMNGWDVRARPKKPVVGKKD